jgi:hypothetical protein
VPLALEQLPIKSSTLKGGEMANISVAKCAMRAGKSPPLPDYTSFEGKTALFRLPEPQ